MTEELKAIARRIRLLALDVDGVLTDGRIHYSGEGEEMKSFSILDGLGIKLVRHCGTQVAIITARRSGAVERRARELGIDHCVQGREDKLEALRELLAGTGLTLAETAYMGDDLPDVPIFMRCGFAVAVPHAMPSVREHAHYVTAREGGHGAVRELAEFILAAQGHDFAGAPPPRAA